MSLLPSSRSRGGVNSDAQDRQDAEQTGCMVWGIILFILSILVNCVFACGLAAPRPSDLLCLPWPAPLSPQCPPAQRVVSLPELQNENAVNPRPTHELRCAHPPKRPQIRTFTFVNVLKCGSSHFSDFFSCVSRAPMRFPRQAFSWWNPKTRTLSLRVDGCVYPRWSSSFSF